MSNANGARPLDELLAQVDLRARIAFRGRACEGWVIGGGQQGRLGFHAVLSGRSWLRVPDQTAPIEMTAGALMIYRPDTEHRLDVVGPHIELLCGYFDGGVTNVPVVDALPDYLIWPNFDAFPEPLERLMRALTSCAMDEQRGVDQILPSLCEILVMMILREPAVLKIESVGVLCAQRDPLLRRVFAAIHARPGRRWTLASLARQAGLSRSAFAARFRQQAEIPAMHYLRRYRVALAERRMREEGISVERAARAIGYGSAGALRRAARRR